MARQGDTAQSVFDPEGQLPRVGQGSLTEQTTRALLDAILERRFTDDRLPAEPELAELLNVSRTTIRAALQSLERLGMLSRAPGRGTVIRPHVGRESIILQRLIGFRDMLSQTHDSVVVEGSYWLQEGATPKAAAELGIATDSQVVGSAKTFLADGAPAIFIRDQIPLDYVSAETRDSLHDGGSYQFTDSIFAFSTTWPGREIDHAVVEMVPCAIPDDGSIPLDLPAGTPYVLLCETHYTALGEPVAYTEVHVDDRYVRFHVVRHH
jgi:GntR family transcriptional regulator